MYALPANVATETVWEQDYRFSSGCHFCLGHSFCAQLEKERVETYM